ncbi:MAG: hypothetical protein M1816_001127 [Peltula sp. TS41687]|nr:MAG: hypothetical protein M1816_001127 [Peltula sp. TS41687]
MTPDERLYSILWMASIEETFKYNSTGPILSYREWESDQSLCGPAWISQAVYYDPKAEALRLISGGSLENCSSVTLPRWKNKVTYQYQPVDRCEPEILDLDLRSLGQRQRVKRLLGIVRKLYVSGLEVNGDNSSMKGGPENGGSADIAVPTPT